MNNKKELENDVLDMMRTHKELSIALEYLYHVQDVMQSIILDGWNEGLNDSDLDELRTHDDNFESAKHAIKGLVAKLTDKIRRTLNIDD